MNCDVTIAGEPAIAASADGAHVLFTAPVDGSMELWRVPIAGGGRPRRTHRGSPLPRRLGRPPGPRRKGRRRCRDPVRRHGLPRGCRARRPGQGRGHPAAHRQPPQRRARGRAGPGRARGAALAMRRARDPGLAAPRRARGPAAGRSRSTADPHTLYGWSPMLEWQVLAGAGISVLASNPRGSEGYGEAFNRANLGDWGDGPMADVVAGVDQAITDGLADPDRLGVTGGSYGGYLTNWIIGKTRPVQGGRHLPLRRRHADAVPHRGHLGRGVGADRVRAQRLGGRGLLPRDLAAVAGLERAHAAADPAQRSATYGRRSGRREALFTVLRSLKRPVRFMRVARREPRAHPQRRAVPAGGEPGPGPRLVRATSWSMARGACRWPRGTAPAGDLMEAGGACAFPRRGGLPPRGPSCRGEEARYRFG